MPSVPMNGGTRSRETSVPLMSPAASAADSAAASPATSASAGSVGVSCCIARAITTDDSPITNPTERSIPPAMMTKVCPSPSSSGSAADCAMLWRLNGLIRNEMP
jgi:hypothetical protein